ncbi:MAG: cation efflux system outer membrane protein [Phycisphaerales bacterium]|nr:cation efflux system outer membrane protein [Phycisphaerales bacterium]
MKSFKSGALALAVATAVCGCAPMPKIQSSEQAAAVAHGIADPFEFKTEREPIDIADATADPAALPFDQAVRRALRHSPTVQAALARVRQAQAESQQARLLPNPVLAVAVKFPTGSGKADIEASIAADLLSLLLKPGRISAADQRLRRSVADSLAVVLDVLAEVRQQYSKAQALAAQVAIDQARRDILTELLRLTDARLRGGEATRLDALTLQSQAASLEAELLSSRSEERQARLELARLIGEPTSTATWTLDVWAAPAPASADESAMLKIAIERRPELQSVVWELAALGQEIKVARFGIFIEGSDAGVAAERSGGSWTIGPAGAIAIPVFDTGQAQRAAISARVIEQRHELTRLERQVVQDVRIAMEQWRSSKAALSQIDERLIPLQNERLKQATSSYKQGVGDVLAVRLAEQDLQQARSQQVDLQEQVSQASYRLLRAIGGAMPAAAPVASVDQTLTHSSGKSQ